jgi:hypothetical protein
MQPQRASAHETNTGLACYFKITELMLQNWLCVDRFIQNLKWPPN